MSHIQSELKKSIFTGDSKHNELEKKLKHPHEKAALGFFKNILSNSKAVILLTQNNYNKEAAAIDHLTIEHLLNLAALIKNPGHLNDLEAQSKSDIKRTLTKIVENQKKTFLPRRRATTKSSGTLRNLCKHERLKSQFIQHSRAFRFARRNIRQQLSETLSHLCALNTSHYPILSQ
ncbi:DUF5677 domain-containing protein [Pseudomonas sp. 8O]|uniref:DUF5677 domain-containing protein n=1 Tax=Pseudomonas sp. 8O TaxID=2653165 RepID=UPI0012F0F302|nr:DUF5677 domain-containing protein [Pseudomonas sp. 8O]VXB75415.1 hypothetical protein PSEUDO8O_170420 [Pseudomonas sp. 8O]